MTNFKTIFPGENWPENFATEKSTTYTSVSKTSNFITLYSWDRFCTKGSGFKSRGSYMNSNEAVFNQLPYTPVIIGWVEGWLNQVEICLNPWKAAFAFRVQSVLWLRWEGKIWSIHPTPVSRHRSEQQITRVRLSGKQNRRTPCNQLFRVDDRLPEEILWTAWNCRKNAVSKAWANNLHSKRNVSAEKMLSIICKAISCRCCIFQMVPLCP